MTGFQVLFSVIIHHHFFESGFTHDINVHPSRATLAQAKNSGIIFKPCIGGLLVLCDLEKVPVLQLYIEDEGLVFDFYITSNNAYLSHCSSIPLLKHGSLLWLKHDSCQSDTPINSVGQYPLHSSDSLSIDDYYLKAEITDYSDYESLSLLVKAFIFVSIKINQKDFSTLITDRASSCDFVTFFIDIKSKSSFWEYRIYLDNIKNNLEISDRNKNIEFNFIRNEQFDGDRNVAIFRSKTEIESKEFSECNFQLIDKRTSGHRVLIKRLPVANVNNGYQEVVDTRLAQISEIFVNF